MLQAGIKNMVFHYIQSNIRTVHLYLHDMKYIEGTFYVQ